MLDPRVAAVRTNDGKIRCLNLVFDTEEQVNEECKRRDRRAGGRTLSPLELAVGLDRSSRVDDYTYLTRPTSQIFKPVFDAEVEDDPNPYRSQAFKDAKAAALGATKPESTAAYLKRMEKEADAKIERETALSEDKINPRRLAAQEYAHQMWLSIAHDKDVPLSLADKIDDLNTQAKTPLASLTYFATLAAECAEQYRGILEARRGKANAAKAAAVADYTDASVPVADFGETPLPPAAKVTKMRGVDGSITYDVTTPDGVLRNSFTPETVPDSVRAAADQQI